MTKSGVHSAVHPAVLEWMQRTGWQQLSTTVINLAEIQCGIERQMASNPHYARGTRNWMGRLLESGGPSVWPLDLAAALALARMYETPALRNFVRSDPQQKSPKSPGDLAVAAIAIANTAAVATRNVAHFREIDRHVRLPGVYDPFAGHWAVEPIGIA